jgi:hypothetical protein
VTWNKQSGEYPSASLRAADPVDAVLANIAPTRLRRATDTPDEIWRRRAIDDLDVATEAAGSISALAREIGVDESEVRIVSNHRQRNVPLKWLHAVGDRTLVAVLINIARHRSVSTLFTLQQALTGLIGEKLNEARSA